MLLAFMMSRGLKKLAGEKSSIGMQANSTASLVIDDPPQIPECFWEQQVTFTCTRALSSTPHTVCKVSMR